MGVETRSPAPRTYAPKTLRGVLRARGRLPLGEVIGLGVAMCDALGHLHRHGLVHRDVKPSNLIFVDGRPKLADIGLVTGIDEAKSFVGTEGYIPPEGPGSVQADLYSLGKVLYEAATGKDRHDFPELPDEFRSTPEGEAFAELNEVLLRACATEPAQRHTTAEQMRAELLLLQAGQSVRGLRTNERLLWRFKLASALGLALMLVLLAGLRLQKQWTDEAVARQREWEVQAQREAAQVRQIEAQAHLLRHTAYAADMTMTAQALERGDDEGARQILQRQIPPSGQPDVRGWEWRHYWHRALGEPSRELPPGTNAMHGLAWLPSGKHLLGCGQEGRIFEWDPAALKRVREWDTGDQLWWSLTVHPAGTNAVAVSALQDQAALLDLHAGTFRLVPLGGESAGFHICAAPDGTAYLHTAGGWGFAATNGVTVIRDAAFENPRRLPESGQRSVFSPEGRLLATGTWIDRIRLWSWPDLKPVGDLGPVGGIASLDFSPDGRWLVSGGNEGELCLWDMSTRSLRHRRTSVHDRSVVGSVRFSPDSQRILTAAGNQRVLVWDVERLEVQRTIRGYTDALTQALWSQDGQSLFSTTLRHGVRIWPAKAPVATASLAVAHARPVCFSPDSQVIAMVNWPVKAVTLQRIGDGQKLAQLDLPREPYGFAREDGALVMDADDPSLRLHFCEVPSFRVLRECVLERPPPGVVVGPLRKLMPDGRRVLRDDSEGHVRVWDLGTGALLRSFKAHPGRLFRMELSHDGRWLLTSGREPIARLWDTDTFSEVMAYHGRAGAGQAITFSPDDRLVAVHWLSGGCDVFERASGRLVSTFRMQLDSGGPVLFTSDGNTLVVGDYDQLRFWNLASGREAGTLRADGPIGDYMTFSPDGQTLVTVTRDGALSLLPGRLPSP